VTGLDTNPTQVGGLLVFAIAALACAHAARRGASPWGLLFVAQLGFMAEVLFGLRHRLHDAAGAVAQAAGWYATRGTLQVSLLAVALVLGSIGLAAVWHWRPREAHASRAVFASCIAFALFAIEAVSLHAIDALMYLRVGPLLLIALLWATTAAVVTWSAWRAVRH
jgi:hypothetical protein